jgi:hypothetical protein
MKYILTLLVALLAGCSTVTPVKITFPSIPNELNVECPSLKKIPDESKLSDIAKTITENYTLYKTCATNNNGLIEWYNKQKDIFNEVK